MAARQDPVSLRSGGELPGRDGCRTPMPWDADAPGLGFTTGEPWLPFGADAAALAVSLQDADPTSTLATYRALLAVRRALLADGLPQDVVLLDTSVDVLAFRRGRLTVVLNTAAEPVEVAIGVGVGGGTFSLVAATAAGAVLADGAVVVPAASTVWVLGEQ